MKKMKTNKSRRQQRSSYLDHDAAGDGQVAVEPGVPDAAAVALHPDLQTALLRPLRPRLHLKHKRAVTQAFLGM